MKETSLDAIRDALGTLLGEFQKQAIPQEGHWKFHRVANGNWQGSFVLGLATLSLFTPHEGLLDRLSAQLTPVLSADYPEIMRLIGLPGVGAGILDPRMILCGLVHECLKRYGTPDISESQLEQLLSETARFFDSPKIRIRLLAPVLNVRGSREVKPIQFPGGIKLRPITDEEVTRFYGGNPIFQNSRRPITFPDFVFEREIEVAKVIGDISQLSDDAIWKPTQEILDRCVLAMSCFKDGGPVGYDGLRISTIELAFGMASGGQQLSGNDHVPVGNYELKSEDAPKLTAFAKLFEDIHPTLEMACQRLVDATRRTRPRDSIVDVTIGLESMLLVEIDEKYRGEVRFRFSLNYAWLFPTKERKAAFHTARDLYDLRSQIAHGGEPKGNVKINKREMSLHEVALFSRSLLRQTLVNFMANSAKPDFLKSGYWVTNALGLRDEEPR